MKTFENPEIEVVRFAVEDIITTSNPDELPWAPLTVEDDLGLTKIG